MTPTPDKPAGEALKARLCKMASLVYLAAEGSAADDISDGLLKAVARIKELEARADPPVALDDEVEAASLLRRWLALDGGAWHQIRHEADKLELRSATSNLLTRLKDSSK